MGKNFCKVEWKWCKYLKHCGLCAYNNTLADVLGRCPRVVEIETTRLYTILHRVKFDVVFSRLCKWFPDQKQNKEGYKKVFDTLLQITPGKHNLNDLFIHIFIDEEDGRKYQDVCGVNPLHANYDKSYGIEFLPWKDWVGMFITQRTLDTLPEEDIVAGCLFEMTFMGFEENQVIEAKNKLTHIMDDFRNSKK